MARRRNAPRSSSPATIEQLDVREQGEILEIRETPTGKFYWRLVSAEGEEIERSKRRFDDSERSRQTGAAHAEVERLREEGERALGEYNRATTLAATSEALDARERYVETHAAHEEALAFAQSLTQTPGARHECELDGLAKYPGRVAVVFGQGEKP